MNNYPTLHTPTESSRENNCSNKGGGQKTMDEFEGYEP